VVKIANREPPTEEVVNLRGQGRSNDEIVSELSQKGFTNTQISEAIGQADIKGGVEGQVPPPTPIETPAMPGESLPGPPEGMTPSALTPGEGEIPIPVPSPEVEEKPSVQAPSMPEVQQPAAQTFMPNTAQSSMDVESVQEIVESVIDERWQEVVASVGDITIWKSKV